MSCYSFFRKKVRPKTTWVPSDEVLPLLARPLLSDGFQGAPGFSCPMSLPSVGSKLKRIVFTMPLRQAMFYKGHHTSLHSASHTLRSAINFTSDIFSSTINWCAPFEKLSRIRANVIDISSVFQRVSGSWQSQLPEIRQLLRVNIQLLFILYLAAFLLSV